MPPLSSIPGIRATHTRTRPAARPRFHVPLSAYVVDCAVYVDGARLPGRFTHDRALAEVRRRGEGFVWIGLHEPDEEQITGIADVFGLHELAVEDAVHAHQRPKLERYDDTLFMVLKTVRYRGAAGQEVVATGEIMVFLGRDFVITVRHGEHSGLTDLRSRLEEERDLLRLGPAAVLYAVADYVVDNFVDVASAVTEDVDELEASVFSPERTDDIGRLYQLKRELMSLRKAVAPLEAPLQKLAERQIDVIPDSMRSYFGDVLDHALRVRDQVNALDELLSSILQASLARTSLADNEDTRRISAWAAMIAVPTLISGIYGMNFQHMPELGWQFGYPLVLVLMAVASVVLYRGFKHNNWL